MRSKVSLLLDQQLVKKIKIRSINEGTSMSRIVERLIEAYLKDPEKKSS